VKGKKSRIFRGSDGTRENKMKEEKVKRVLDWLTLKRVKNIQQSLRLANYYQ